MIEARALGSERACLQDLEREPLSHPLPYAPGSSMTGWAPHC